MSLFDFFRKKPTKKVESVKKSSEPQKAQSERFKAQSRQSGTGLSNPVRNDNNSPDPIDYSFRYWESSDNTPCHSSSSDSGSSSSSYDSCSSSDSSSSCCD